MPLPNIGKTGGVADLPGRFFEGVLGSVPVDFGRLRNPEELAQTEKMLLSGRSLCTRRPTPRGNELFGRHLWLCAMCLPARAKVTFCAASPTPKSTGLGVVDAGVGRPAHVPTVQAAGRIPPGDGGASKMGGRRFRIRRCRRLREWRINSAIRKHSVLRPQLIMQRRIFSAGPKSLNLRQRCRVLAPRRSCVLALRRYSAAVHRRGW
jgi:hypothetical protein